MLITIHSILIDCIKLGNNNFFFPFAIRVCVLMRCIRLANDVRFGVSCHSSNMLQFHHNSVKSDGAGKAWWQWFTRWMELVSWAVNKYEKGMRTECSVFTLFGALSFDEDGSNRMLDFGTWSGYNGLRRFNLASRISSPPSTFLLATILKVILRMVQYKGLPEHIRRLDQPLFAPHDRMPPIDTCSECSETFLIREANCVSP